MVWRQQERVALAANAPPSSDLPGLIDPCCSTQYPSGALGNEVIEVRHPAACPKEGVKLSSDGAGYTDDFVMSIDLEGAAKGTTERTKVGHRAVAPEESMLFSFSGG